MSRSAEPAPAGETPLDQADVRRTALGGPVGTAPEPYDSVLDGAALGTGLELPSVVGR